MMIVQDSAVRYGFNPFLIGNSTGSNPPPHERFRGKGWQARPLEPINWIEPPKASLYLGAGEGGARGGR